jgi:GTP cyclohydrolase II
MRQTLSRFAGPVYVHRMTAKDSGKKGAVLLSPEHRIERAAGDLRRGAPVLIGSARAGESAVVAAAETVTDATLAALTGQFGTGMLILTHARAETLKIRLYTPEAVGIALPAEGRAEDLRAIADPTTDLDYPLKGPFETIREPLPDSAPASVHLAKLAGLLPAVVLFPIADDVRVCLAQEGVLSQAAVPDIAGFEDSAAKSLRILVRSRVPLLNAEDAELIAFRPQDGGPEHYAVLIGAKDAPALAPPGPILTRLHSECFTGDFLGSLKCDCGDQLRGAIETIAKAGGGVLLYLAQEGRGIGLMNKLRAYRLQDEGFDTMEANRRLGFADDERLYAIAARMLQLLGYSKARLLTNNPGKMRALEAAGIAVVERVPHSFPDNEHNREYLRTKAEKGGHLL